jgi:hypothetical protein
MPALIEHDHFLNPLLGLLDETFEKHRGIFLDANTSLFQTLESISAAQASIPVGGKCASLAAQVAHIVFYLEVLERYVVSNDTSRADWGAAWKETEKVSPTEWDALRLKLRQAYVRIREILRFNPNWNEDSIGGALAIVVHTAYHLGEIRQALCILPDRR